MTQIEIQPDKIIDRTLYGVDVIIFNQHSELLMLEREVMGEEFKTGWEPVKGAIKHNETYTQGAFREAQEEASGLTPKLVGQLDNEYEVDARYRNKAEYDYIIKRAVVMFAEKKDVTIDAQEHKRYAWMTPDEARDVIWIEYGVEIITAAEKLFTTWKKRHVSP